MINEITDISPPSLELYLAGYNNMMYTVHVHEQNMIMKPGSHFISDLSCVMWLINLVQIANPIIAKVDPILYISVRMHVYVCKSTTYEGTTCRKKTVVIFPT